MRFELDLSMDVLRRSPGIFFELLGDIDEGWSRATEGPATFSPFDVEGTWNARDVVGHLIDGEETDWIPRARIILAGGDNPASSPTTASGIGSGMRNDRWLRCWRSSPRFGRRISRCSGRGT